MKERDLQKRVISIANKMGWRPFHQYDSQHSIPGFPDLVLAFGPDPVELPEGIDDVDYYLVWWRGNKDTSRFIPIPSRIVVVELKTSRTRYGVTDDQKFWLHCFRRSGVQRLLFGSRRIFLEIADKLGKIARPLWSYPKFDADAAYDRREASKEESKVPF